MGLLQTRISPPFTTMAALSCAVVAELAMLQARTNFRLLQVRIHTHMFWLPTVKVLHLSGPLVI